MPFQIWWFSGAVSVCTKVHWHHFTTAEVSAQPLYVFTFALSNRATECVCPSNKWFQIILHQDQLSKTWRQKRQHQSLCIFSSLQQVIIAKEETMGSNIPSPSLTHFQQMLILHTEECLDWMKCFVTPLVVWNDEDQLIRSLREMQFFHYYFFLPRDPAQTSFCFVLLCFTVLQNWMRRN